MKGYALACLLIARLANAAVSVPLEVLEECGVDRRPGHVTGGVPFPMGLLKSIEEVRLVDGLGVEVPLQIKATATWRDGSVKWVLLDFPASVPAFGTRRYTLETGVASARGARPSSLRIASEGERIRVVNDRLEMVFSKQRAGFLESTRIDRNRNGRFEDDPRILSWALEPSLTVTNDLGGMAPRTLPPEELAVEEVGANRAVIKAVGWITDGTGNRLVRYTTRLHVHGSGGAMRIQHTLTQLSDRYKMLWVSEHSLRIPAPELAATRYSFGGDSRAHTGNIQAAQRAVLSQFSESRYTVIEPAGRTDLGLKAAGWASLSGEHGGVTVAINDFWQQHPISIGVFPNGITLGLFPKGSSKPFDMDQGLAKTHEILISLEGAGVSDTERAAAVRALQQPLFAVAPSQWYCDSKVFGTLLPFDFDQFPDYETLTEASGDQFIKRMATGGRHWGDVYYGGEYKGTNSYTNLEYDMHHNFFCQFARTGLKKYLTTALVMAQHQADIDTNHKTGWQWKHSPRHVEIQAEFGHTFTRGLLEAYFLGGNRLCLEAAVELGDYFAREIRNSRALGNERQIGWSLISLLPVYEATWDQRYFEAASNTVERLLAGLDERGKFNIRWDNRIAFFNGIAATGLIYYQRATGDERVAEAAYKVIRRARGFYPEYNGRTLEAIAWAWERTGKREWLDFLARTWETTLAQQVERNAMELGAPTIFTVHALPALLQAGLLPPLDRRLELAARQMDSCHGLHARHLPWGQAELFLELKAGEALDLVIIRKGAWKGAGEMRLYDPVGRSIQEVAFPRESQVWQRKEVRLTPGSSGAWRLVFDSVGALTSRGGSAVTWDVVSSRPVRGVFATPGHRGMEYVTPRLFCASTGPEARIELEVAGEGEGFKRAVICNPSGQVVGSTEAFIDLGDKGRYCYKVSAAVQPANAAGVWSIVLEGVTLETLKGVTPFFSTSERSFFRPDRP